MVVSAQLVKKARIAAGLTQSELARRAGTSQPAIAAYESGDKVPTVATLERLLRAAGRTLTMSDVEGVSGRASLRALLRERREAIVETAKRHHAGNVRVFGSVARGEENEASDVDLIVELEPGSSLLDLVRLRRALRELLEVEVDVLTSRGLFDRDADTILRDAVPI